MQIDGVDDKECLGIFEILNEIYHLRIGTHHRYPYFNGIQSILRSLIDTVILVRILNFRLSNHSVEPYQYFRPARIARDEMHREQPLAILLQVRKLRIQPFQQVDSLAARVDFAAKTFDGILRPVIFRTRMRKKNEKKQQINDTYHVQQDWTQ